MRTTLTIIGGIMLVLAGFVGYLINDNQKPQEQEFGLVFQGYAGDVIGTKVGTTTTAVGFGADGSGTQSATSSYITLISGSKDMAIYTLNAKEASSTANLDFAVWGSNDYGCDSATSTTILDIVESGDVNWFDIGVHALNLAGTQGIQAATSTWHWDITANNTNRVLVLKDLNYECLRLDVSGASTTLWAEIKLK
jgi:hypothetical protein